MSAPTAISGFWSPVALIGSVPPDHRPTFAYPSDRIDPRRRARRAAPPAPLAARSRSTTAGRRNPESCVGERRRDRPLAARPRRGFPEQPAHRRDHRPAPQDRGADEDQHDADGDRALERETERERARFGLKSRSRSPLMRRARHRRRGRRVTLGLLHRVVVGIAAARSRRGCRDRARSGRTPGKATARWRRSGARPGWPGRRRGRGRRRRP